MKDATRANFSNKRPNLPQNHGVPHQILADRRYARNGIWSRGSADLPVYFASEALYFDCERITGNNQRTVALGARKRFTVNIRTDKSPRLIPHVVDFKSQTWQAFDAALACS